MNTTIAKLVLECEDKLLMLRDYIEMNWNGWDKDWAHDQVNKALNSIDKLLPEKEDDNGEEFSN